MGLFLSNLAWILMGFLSVYLNTKTSIIDMAKEKIYEAEILYSDATKAGSEKFAWVVDHIYYLIPGPMRFLFTKEMIGSIVQNVFDVMEKYATTQLDKMLSNIVKR